MKGSSRLAAFLAYLLPVLGWIYVLVSHRRDRFAVYHLKQSLAIFLFLIAVFLGWAVLSWLLVFIPLAGPLTAVMLFSLVIGALIFAVVLWIMGMVRSLRGEMRSLPLVGARATALPID